MEPELVFWYDKRGADKPHPRLSFFNENLPSSKLLAKRNLSIRANDLNAGLANYGIHVYSVLASSSCRLRAH